MKATIVIDNIAKDKLQGEWGLCIYIEYNGKNVLLDAGSTTLFSENAKKLQLSLADVDYAILSHAHYDHANGMEQFFKENTKASFYIQHSCKENCYKRVGIFHKYIGMPKGILTKYRDRIHFVEKTKEIDDGIWLVSHTTKGLSSIGKCEKMYRKESFWFYPDDFSHEQSLVFDTENGLVICNSCSHGGVLNIIHEVLSQFPEKNILAIIGGFHIYNKSEDEIRSLGRLLKDTGIPFIYTGHCTGNRAFQILKEELGDRAVQLHVGMEIQF